MVTGQYRRRYKATPTTLEVNVRAIRLLSPQGWRLCSLDDVPLVGTVPKNYLVYGDPRKSGTRAYIAKMGRTNNSARECVTEEIISRIGALLPLVMARSKLARLSNDDVRFLSLNFVVLGRHELLHGIELVARYFDTSTSELESAFDLDTREGELSLYTIDTILTVLESLYPHEFCSLKENFYKMLAFDAFIGAPDRHAMNWGVLAPFGTKTEAVRFAPIFDTARGLFREISDADLLQKETRQGREQFLVSYSERSRPILSTGGSTGQNHFSLVERIIEDADDAGRKAVCEVFDAVDMCSIEHLLQRHFRRIITQYRIGLIKDLLSLRIRRIRKAIYR